MFYGIAGRPTGLPVPESAEKCQAPSSSQLAAGTRPRSIPRAASRPGEGAPGSAVARGSQIERETSFRTAHAVRNAADLALSIDHGRAAVIALDAQHVANAGLLRCRQRRGEAEQSSKDQQEAGASQ